MCLLHRARRGNTWQGNYLLWIVEYFWRQAAHDMQTSSVGPAKLDHRSRHCTIYLKQAAESNPRN